MIELMYGTRKRLSFELPEDLGEGRSPADVTGAIFMLKTNRNDPDEEALVTRTLGDGIVKSGNVLVCDVRAEDYDEGLHVDRVYTFCLGWKFAGDLHYREPDEFEHDRVKITPDRVRG